MMKQRVAKINTGTTRAIKWSIRNFSQLEELEELMNENKAG